MTQPAVINLLIALVAMFLSGNTTLGGLGAGLLAGFALLAFFRKTLNCQDYIRRVTSLIAFAWRFMGQVLSSNLRMARLVLRKDAGEIQGRFLRYNIEGLTEFEVLLLCGCISVTPGTAVADQDQNGRELILHAFDADEPDRVCSYIDQDLRDNILKFTR